MVVQQFMAFLTAFCAVLVLKNAKTCLKSEEEIKFYYWYYL